ncbi:MAG: type IV secretion system DNA-binding domain-containing protein [Patescibacteria group bacterium]
MVYHDHDHDNEVVLFAETNFRNQKRRFGVKTDDRRRHFYCIGKTGMGKSTLLENMIIADIKAGHGVCVVDPHGDLAEKILEYIPSNRVNDVIYFNPADMDFPIGFNVLESVDTSHKHLIASGLMGVFKKIWPDVWSARMEYILNNAILALIEYPGSTLLGINRLLTDKEYRKRVLGKVNDPVVKKFWLGEYANYTEKFQNEAIAPIQNKVGQFLSTSIIRNIVAQVKSTINMREIMDTGKIFIVNLSKGRIGEDNSRLLGGILITRLQLAAMERVDIPEKERRDFYLYVDEFQNFATESFANILSEARKYRLNLIMAHQYIEQLDETVRAAVFGNVGTLVVFRVGAADSLFLVNEFAPHCTEEDLVNLTKFDIYLKLMIDGVASRPFSATTLSPLTEPTGQKDKIIRVSREHYAEPRETVEKKVMQWSGFGETGQLEDETNEPAQAVRPTLAPRGRQVLQRMPSDQRRPAPSTPRPATPSFVEQTKQTEPVIRTTPEVKPLSLSEALGQKPIANRGLGMPRREPQRSTSGGAGQAPQQEQSTQQEKPRPEPQRQQAPPPTPVPQGEKGLSLTQLPSRQSAQPRREQGPRPPQSQGQRDQNQQGRPGGRQHQQNALRQEEQQPPAEGRQQKEPQKSPEKPKKDEDTRPLAPGETISFD